MKVLIVLANGFNEIETSAIIEVLRTGGVDAVTAGIPGAQVTGSHGLTVMTQSRLSDVRLDDFNAVVFPGGNSVYINSLSSSVTIQQLLNKFNNMQKWIGTINNSALILQKYGLIVEGIKTTTHASIEKKFPSPRPGPVIVDRNFVTGTDTAASIDFAVKLLETLVGDAQARRVKEQYQSRLPTRRMM